MARVRSFRILFQNNPPPDPDSESQQTLLPSSSKPHNPISNPQLLLILSLITNLLLTLLLLFPTPPSLPSTPFASLTRDLPVPWTSNHPGDLPSWTSLWENSTSYSPGVIALSDAYARAKSLPRAQRWPWNPSKGIYIVNAYHNLHCVVSLRNALEEFREGREQSSGWDHVRHCLLVLREEIMCEADDTPRYTGFQPQRGSGLGQVRMCRDWEKLERWVKEGEREGCWRDSDELGDRVVDRYRFCEKGEVRG